MALASGCVVMKGPGAAGWGVPFSLSGVSCREPRKDHEDDRSVWADGAKSPGLLLPGGSCGAPGPMPCGREMLTAPRGP